MDILVSKQGDFLKIEIKDNGIGFEQSKKLNSISIKGESHFGLKLTRKRLELFSKHSKLEIIALPQGGASVSILIPL